MRDARQGLWGIVIAFVSIALLIGILSLSLVEGHLSQSVPTRSQTATSSKVLLPSASRVESATPSVITVTYTFTPTWTPTWTPTLPPTPSNCPPPVGWQPYIVQPGDTLNSLAARYKRSSQEISQANCLGIGGVISGQLLYLPLLPTQTPIRCGAPATWIIYIVQPGDTLYHLGQVYGIPFTDIQRANCMNTTTLIAGQKLYVPPWATRTPSPTYPGYPTSFYPSNTPVGSTTPDYTTPTDTAIPTFTPYITITIEPPATNTVVP